MAYWGQALALGPNLNAPMTLDNGRLGVRGDSAGYGKEIAFELARACAHQSPGDAVRALTAPATEQRSIARTQRQWKPSRRVSQVIRMLRRSTPMRG